MDFTPEQRAAILTPGHLVVAAGAGSGKTRVLVERYLRLVDEVAATVAPGDDPFAAVLAVTFTEKAAREMRDRVRQTAAERARRAPPAERAAADAYAAAAEAARIGTIHSFCAELLRAHPAETGLDPRFVILDEVEAGALIAASVEETLRSAAAGTGLAALLEEFAPAELADTVASMLQSGGELRAALDAMPTIPAKLLARWEARLEEAREEAVADLFAAPGWRAAATTILALAPAAPPGDRIGEQVIAVAAWLRGVDDRRLTTDDRQAATVHLQPPADDRQAATVHLQPPADDRQAATVHLQPPADDRQATTDDRQAATVHLQPPADDWQPRGAASADAVRLPVVRGQPWAPPDFSLIDRVNLTGGAKRAWGDEEALRSAKAALRELRDAYRAAAELIAYVPDSAVEARTAAVALALRDLAIAADAAYTRRKGQLDRLDFDDLERRARELLEGHPAARARWRRELSAVLVDEFQDTNEDQRAIIYALAGGEAAPALFVVGDGKQSIYRFRGADVSVFRQVEADILAWGGARVTMRASFRSHRALVELVNTVSAQLFARPGALAPYEVPFEPLEATRPAPPHPLAAELHLTPADEDAPTGREREAAILAGRIAALVRGDEGAIVFDHERQAWRAPTYDDIAILCRASGSFEAIEAALRSAGIPFLTTAGRGYYGRKEVQDLINLLRALDDPADELALVGVLRSPLFALDDATVIGLRLAGGGLWAALGRAARDPEATPELAPLFHEQAEALRFAATTLGELTALRGRATVAEILRAALDRTGYVATISALADGERRRANLEKLLAAARLAGARGVRAFSAYLDQLLRAEAREGEAPLEAEGAVRLMTIHRSKGLEFPIVALPDLGRATPREQRAWLARRSYGLAVRAGQDHEGPPPSALLLAQRAEALMERAEGERLLYVALTRAQDYLILSGPAQRKGGERWVARLAEALGHPWEDGGPPDGALGALRVYRHG